MITAVVAQTKDSAKRLAQDLGLETRFLFGSGMHHSFYGLRADLVLVDASATIDPKFVETIRKTVRKRPGGRVRFVTVTDGSAA